jgi:hypothetical protein
MEEKIIIEPDDNLVGMYIYNEYNHSDNALKDMIGKTVTDAYYDMMKNVVVIELK